MLGDYEFSASKAKSAKEAVDRRSHEEGKRRAYEERMARKAKREGRPPDYYLQKGEDMGWVMMMMMRCGTAKLSDGITVISIASHHITDCLIDRHMRSSQA